MDDLYYSLYDPGYDWEGKKFLESNGEEVQHYSNFENFSYACHDFKIYERCDKLYVQYNEEALIEITNQYKEGSLQYYKNIISYQCQNDNNHIFSMVF